MRVLAFLKMGHYLGLKEATLSRKDNVIDFTTKTEAPSGTSTMLRLISYYNESDGRFVHMLLNIQNIFTLIFTFKSAF